ncbi:hypothetical protein J6590_031814 [Homalodisca vitripennis]|nr:hypothetical protein J6590_031814 [Homalodisca vitripennis]
MFRRDSDSQAVVNEITIYKATVTTRKGEQSSQGRHLMSISSLGLTLSQKVRDGPRTEIPWRGMYTVHLESGEGYPGIPGATALLLVSHHSATSPLYNPS